MSIGAYMTFLTGTRQRVEFAIVAIAKACEEGASLPTTADLRESGGMLVSIWDELTERMERYDNTRQAIKNRQAQGERWTTSQDALGGYASFGELGRGDPGHGDPPGHLGSGRPSGADLDPDDHPSVVPGDDSGSG